MNASIVEGHGPGVVRLSGRADTRPTDSFNRDPVGDVARRGRILVIDDTPLNIRLLISILRDVYDVIFAIDGNKGLELANAEPLPDLILLDVSMPDPDGYEVCRRLKADERTRSIPVIFVTSNDSESAEAYGINLGAADYITRPISGPILHARARTHINARRQALKYEQLALGDGLTGLANRRCFDQRLRHEWERAQRTGQALSLLFADIDYFKHYNDTHGHGAGDLILRDIAELLLRIARRPSDLAARYGGEELVLLMPNTDIDGAVAVGESLRAAVEKLKFGEDALTISIGCHAMTPSNETSPQELVDQADAELYRAKRAGRNRVYWSRRS